MCPSSLTRSNGCEVATPNPSVSASHKFVMSHLRSECLGRFDPRGILGCSQRNLLAEWLQDVRKFSLPSRPIRGREVGSTDELRPFRFLQNASYSKVVAITRGRPNQTTWWFVRRRHQCRKEDFKMNQSYASTEPATTDVGRIRLGGGWRLPANKPVG